MIYATHFELPLMDDFSHASWRSFLGTFFLPFGLTLAYLRPGNEEETTSPWTPKWKTPSSPAPVSNGGAFPALPRAQAARMNVPNNWKGLIDEATKHEAQMLANATGKKTQMKNKREIEVSV